MKRILLIEDDTLLGQGLRDYLHDHGYACEWVTAEPTGRKALVQYRSGDFGSAITRW